MRKSPHHVSRTVTKSRTQQRTYPGQDTAEPLVKWLNRVGTGDLVELLDTAERYRKLEYPESQTKSKIAGLLKAKINSILIGYKFSPVVDRIGHRWKVEWCARGSNVVDAWVFLFAIDLAERGLLHKLKRCANPTCGKWLFAGTDSKRFHSPSCAVKNFHSRDEWKQHRADYMREWRQNPRTKSRERRRR